MSKKQYFPHDYSAMRDPKMQRVVMRHGLAGVGCYWALIELLYEQGGECIAYDAEAIAFGLHCDTELVESVINDFDLFVVEDGSFWSRSVSARLTHREAISEARREAGRKGAEVTNFGKNSAKSQQTSAIAEQMPMQDAANAEQKVGKGKEIKENKEIKEKISLYKRDTKEKKEKTTQSADFSERERVFELFYFLNFQNPQQEVQRFYDYYEANGWCRNNSTTPVRDKVALARQWQPKDTTARMDIDVLRWVNKIYQLAKAKDTTQAMELLLGIERVAVEQRAEGQTVVMTMATQAQAMNFDQYTSQVPFPKQRLIYRFKS